MNGDSGGFIDGDQMLVFQQRGKFPGRSRPFGLFRHTFRNPNRRQTDQIPCLDSGICVGAAFIHPHLSASDNAVNVRLGDAFQLTYQKVIKPLTGEFRIDFDDAYCRSGDWRGMVCRFALYNVFHLRDECVSG